MSHFEITFRIPFQAKEIDYLDDVKREITGEACLVVRRFYPPSVPLERALEEARSELEELFKRAVDRQVQWDEPPGSG